MERYRENNVLKYAVAILVFVFVICFAFAANAQGACAPEKLVYQGLKDVAGEVLIMYGQALDGHLMALFAKLDRSTWTILDISPDHIACVVRAGEGLELHDTNIMHFIEVSQ